MLVNTMFKHKDHEIATWHTKVQKEGFDKPYGIHNQIDFPIITGTVDSSFASHPDLNGRSSWSVHIGGDGVLPSLTQKSKLLLMTALHHVKLVVHTCLFQII